MPKSLPLALVVIVVGGLAGVAIAGRPVASDPFVLDPSITVDEPTASNTVVITTTSVVRPTTIPASTPAATTTTAAATTTIAATTTDVPNTTIASTTTLPGPLPRDQVRLVIANGDGRFRLASITADRIRPLGYIIGLGDTLQRVTGTVIYYRPGFDDEAAYVATDIGVPDALIIAFPTDASAPITDSDDSGDVIIVLGADAPR